MDNALNWFEIPATDIERATGFYSAIFETKLEITDMYPGFKMAMFPYESGKVGGAIVHGDGCTPSTDGTVVYLNGGDDLSVVLNRVEGAGGKVLGPKQDLGENGFVGMFVDTEGNRVGLHSMG